MIIDERTEFADAQTAVQTAGAGAITDVYDTGSLPVLKDIGGGKTLWGVITIDTTFVGATSTSTFALVSDSTANLATSPTVHWTSAAIPVATLVAGYTIMFALPPEMTYERYLGFTFMVGTANTTAGAFSAFLQFDHPRVPAAVYPDAQN